MMPRSHFLFGFFAGAVASLFIPGIGFWHIFLSGVAAVLVDVDHFICHMLETGEFSLTGMWKRCFNNNYKKELKKPVYKSRFVHGWQGFVLLTVLMLPLLVYNPLLGISTYTGYYSHLIADWIAGKKFYRSVKPYVIEVKHMMYPVVVDELIFDVMVFDIAMIILLYRGMG